MDNMERTLKIRFNVSVLFDAMYLFERANSRFMLDLKKAVKHAFVGSNSAKDEIRTEMENLDISDEYLEMFDCADDSVLFDKYISVKTSEIVFDYSESACCRDRAECYFRIPCIFDASKYISAIDRENAKLALPEISGWQLLDDSCFQYGKKICTENDGSQIWSFVQLEGMPGSYRVRGASNIRLSDYSREYIENEVESYYSGGVKEVELTYPDSYQQIILEILFEQEQGDNCHSIKEVSNIQDGCRVIREWLEPDGQLYRTVQEFLKNHEKETVKKSLNDEMISVQVYSSSVAPEINNDSVTTLAVDKKILLHWFIERILPKLKDIDRNNSDEELLAKWLCDYMPSETADLFDYITSFEELHSRDWYVKKYNDTWNSLVRKAKSEGIKSPEDYASEYLELNASVEEIVGSYIIYHGDNAYRDWMENLKFYQQNGRNDRESFKVQDEKVTHILESLFDQVIVYHIEWYIPEGKKVSSKLSETAVVEKPGTDKFHTDRLYTERIHAELVQKYGYVPKAFTFRLPDGRIGGYRNWNLSSSEKTSAEKDQIAAKELADLGGTGCYGAGSEACLKFCTGCDNKHDDDVPCDWIIGISCSKQSGVITGIVTGTQEDVKKYLATCVQSDRDTDRDNWKRGTEKADNVDVGADGILFAYGKYADYHIDYTANPIQTAKKTDLTHTSEVA